MSARSTYGLIWVDLDEPVPKSERAAQIREHVAQSGRLREIGRFPSVLLTGQLPHKVGDLRLAELDTDVVSDLLRSLTQEDGRLVRRYSIPRSKEEVDTYLFEAQWVSVRQDIVGVVGTLFSTRSDRATREARFQEVRQNVAQDLHDGVGQLITSIRILAEEIADSLDDATRREVRFATSIQRLARRAREEIRDLSGSLSEPGRRAVEKNVVETLLEVKEHIDLLPGMACSVHTGIDPERVGVQVAAVVEYVTREAVANALRHGDATEISIRLEGRKGEVHLAVADDGSGIEENDVDRPTGLANMQARAARVGGEIEMVTGSGGGTTVRCRIPFEQST